MSTANAEGTDAVSGQMPVTEKLLEWMPVIGTPLMLRANVLNEEWAQKNHYQSLRGLARRGGLSLSEAAAIATRRQWCAMSADDALAQLQKVAERTR